MNYFNAFYAQRAAIHLSGEQLLLLFVLLYALIPTMLQLIFCFAVKGKRNRHIPTILVSFFWIVSILEEKNVINLPQTYILTQGGSWFRDALIMYWSGGFILICMQSAWLIYFVVQKIKSKRKRND